MQQLPLYLFCALLIFIGAVEAAVFWMLPLWERPGLYFSVTVSPEFRSSPEGRRILRRYRTLAIILVAIGCALVIAGGTPRRWPLLILGIVWLGFGPLIAFQIAREAVTPHAAKPVLIREAELAARAAHLPGGWLLQAGPFAILCATAIFLHAHWNRIPEIFPVHWGIDGRPNGWSARTPMGVYGPLMMGGAIVAGLALITYGVLREARVVRVPGAATHGRDFPYQVGYFLSGMEYLLAILLSFVALLPLFGPPNIAAVLGGSIVFIAVIFVAAHHLNQTRAHASERSIVPTPGGVFGDGTLDEHWKLGMFYYNPDDPALLVEKRLGIGYTFNFARGLAWIILALMIVVPVALAFAALARRG
ncbi:MAG: DUF1648 domain-containing protein [Acidobacteriota bacterium]|nr:DUF1648 domain-containing protein [Acidobacteriota bacterium]